MGVILVYDWDFFHYPNVIPNLECAKYSAYAKKKRQIVTFSNELIPEKYTSVFLRKEYDDGIYDNNILKENVVYGGRAFSDTYKPFNMEMETIEPDMDIYWKYSKLYGTNEKDKTDIKTILNATHFRASLDGQNLLSFPYERLRPRHPSIVLHDYDLASIPNILDYLLDLNTYGKSRGYRIGNKYPINVYDYQTLKNWLQVLPMGSCFYVQYNGFLTEEETIDLAEDETLKVQQVIYNFTYNCPSEQYFIQDMLPLLYKQLLYLRRNKKKFLLNIDENFFQTPELFNLICLLESFYKNTTWIYNRVKNQTLYGYCSSKTLINLQLRKWITLKVSREQMRESFQFVRKHNYEVFSMFYDTPSIIVKGGKLVNEWNRDI